MERHSSCCIPLETTETAAIATPNGSLVISRSVTVLHKSCYIHLCTVELKGLNFITGNKVQNAASTVLNAFTCDSLLKFQAPMPSSWYSTGQAPIRH